MQRNYENDASIRMVLGDLAAFEKVADRGSFTRAAVELGMSTSALSHAIKNLEARLGIRLLQRSNRSVAPSEAGEEFLRTLAPALRDIERGLERLHSWRDSASGTVRITTVRHAYETIIRPVLPQLSRDYPEVTVEVLIDYGLRDIVAERLDAGIRLGEMVEKDMIAVRVGPDLRMAAVASSGYVEKRGAPRTPRDLAGHRCINYRLMGSDSFYAWEFERDGETLDVHVGGQLTFNEPDTMLGAALDGLGVAYVFEDQIQSHVAEGSLVRLLEDWTPPFPGFHLYYPSRRQTPPALAALIGALRRSWASSKDGYVR